MRTGNGMNLLQTGITELKSMRSGLHDWSPTHHRPGLGRHFRSGRIRGRFERGGTPERHRVLVMWYLCLSRDGIYDGYYKVPASSPAAVTRFDADLAAWDASYAKRGESNYRFSIIQNPSGACPFVSLFKNPYAGGMPTGMTYYQPPSLSMTLADFQRDFAAVSSGMQGAPTKVILGLWGSGFSSAALKQCCDWMKHTKKIDWLYLSGAGSVFNLIYRWIYTAYQLCEHHAFNYQMTPYTDP